MNISLQNKVIQASFSSKNVSEKKEKKEHYEDPLLNWPIRGLAYSNELGAALSEIAPRFGTLLWFPAMLYFGADFYDKYKNEKTSYNPNAQRGTQQVIFQILASVILPTASVFAGQKTASTLGSLGKEGLSLQSKEDIIKFLQKFISRKHLDKYADNIKEFKSLFEEAIITKRERLFRSHKNKNILATVSDFIFSGQHSKKITISQKDKVLIFANKNIDDIFKIYSDLVKNEKPGKFSSSLWEKFIHLKTKYSNDPDFKKTSLRDAAEDVIMKYQKNKILNLKFLKTVGGFVALGLAIKPIDFFVENVIMKKYIEPQLNYLFDNKKKDTIPNALKLEN